ncbi:MAG TPA: RIO1 family regulatory kinase/ATPase [Candidatus Bathyarchaeia archaeon]|nr:RIO1 family regulatory kinase/ATPase [Candidatus Bathyarchaeia archaeon]
MVINLYSTLLQIEEQRDQVLKKTAPIPIEKLSEEPYASIVCYPKPSKTELRNRICELKRLGVNALIFSGKKQVFNLSVLGKGCVGIVTLAFRKSEKTALKIRRTDADRSRMRCEAELLKKANSVSVGPKLLGVSKNFLLMQYIDGDLLPAWLEKRRGKTQTKKVFREVLEQCYRLDKIGLDHGELSHAPKHVIISKEGEPFIVDFETASIDRRPSNVTSICQFLFIGSESARKIAESLGEKDKTTVVEALRLYKSNRTRENFKKILTICSL